jgi:hypothetical protein
LFLSLILAILGLKIIKYFSLVHNWHTFVTWLKGLALLTIFQLTSYPIFWSCSLQICFDKVVEFFGFLVLKLDLRFLNLSLKGGSESPMYVSTLSSSLVTVAWYTTPDCKHFPWTGHSFFTLHIYSIYIYIGVGKGEEKLVILVSDKFTIHYQV